MPGGPPTPTPPLPTDIFPVTGDAGWAGMPCQGGAGGPSTCPTYHPDNSQEFLPDQELCYRWSILGRHGGMGHGLGDPWWDMSAQVC